MKAKRQQSELTMPIRRQPISPHNLRNLRLHHQQPNSPQKPTPSQGAKWEAPCSSNTDMECNAFDEAIEPPASTPIPNPVPASPPIPVPGVTQDPTPPALVLAQANAIACPLFPAFQQAVACTQCVCECNMAGSIDPAPMGTIPALVCIGTGGDQFVEQFMMAQSTLADPLDEGVSE